MSQPIAKRWIHYLQKWIKSFEKLPKTTVIWILKICPFFFPRNSPLVLWIKNNKLRIRILGHIRPRPKVCLMSNYLFWFKATRPPPDSSWFKWIQSYNDVTACSFKIDPETENIIFRLEIQKFFRSVNIFMLELSIFSFLRLSKI